MKATVWQVALAALMIVVLAAAGALFGGCSDATRARIGQSGPAVITLYSGGKAVKTWTSTGKVKSEDDSDGWYFVDASTNHLIIVSGSITIEPKP